MSEFCFLVCNQRLSGPAVIFCGEEEQSNPLFLSNPNPFFQFQVEAFVAAARSMLVL